MDPGDQIMTNDVDGKLELTGGEERCIQSFGEGNLREGDHLENLRVDGSIILK